MRRILPLLCYVVALALSACVNPSPTPYREYFPGQGWVEFPSQMDSPDMYRSNGKM